MKFDPVIILTVCICFGCASPQQTSRTIIELDTVAIVDIAEPPGSSDGLIDFPNAGARLSNGNIVVNDLWGGRLSFFDPKGKLIRTIGKKGSGPGEYNVLFWTGVCGLDSIHATTDAMRQWVIDSAGRIVRDQLFNLAVPHPYACNRNHIHVFVKAERMAHAPRSTDPPLEAEISVGTDYSTRKDLGRFESWEYGPTRPQMRIAMSDKEVFLGSGASGTVKVYSTNGKLLREIETGATRGAPTDAEYDAALNELVSAFADEETREQNKEIMRERFPKPNKAAAFSRLAASPKGVLWITQSHPGNSRTRLLAIAPDGGRSTAIVSVDLRVFETGEDYVLGRYEDAEGFPHVVLYRYKQIPNH